jgi:hypothetical protein
MFPGITVAAPDNCMVWEQYEPSSSIPKTPKYYYTFEWDQLPSKVGWDAAAFEKFPVELSDKAIVAWSLMASQTTNHIRLGSIKLERLDYHQPSVIGRFVSSNQWFIVFTFTQSENDKLRSVVLLLDGTQAKENDGSVNPSSALLARSHTMRFTSKDLLINTNSISETSNAPEGKIFSPDLEIPRVQWNPNKNPFPFDLSSQSARAKDYVSRIDPQGSNSISLVSIRLSRFTPAEAVQSRGLNLADHLNHWIITFVYHSESPSGTEREEFQLVMLLDGSILGGREIKM